MITKKVLMDFSDVHKFEKTAEFSHNSKRYMVSIGINPWNDDVLFSLYIDRQLVVENRVCLVGDALVDSFGAYQYETLGGFNFAFLPTSDSYPIGSLLDWRDLQDKMELYFIDLSDE